MTEPALASSLVQRLVAIARGELDSYGGVLETDPRLRKRIYETYLAQLDAADPDNSLGWDMPSDITSWPWSAVFVSWCVLAAGVTRGQFALSVRHAIYVRAAIANTQANRGVFRGHPIGDYAPRLGDIIVANRGTGAVTYDQAAGLESYDSHGAIVVDFITQGGKRYAITVGGNESQSVHSAQIELTAAGLIKARSKYPYICVIQNLAVDTAAGAALLATAEVSHAGLPAAFRGHGTFVYDLAATIADYGSTANMVAAMKRAQMQHAWVRIHGTAPDSAATIARTRAAIDALRAAGIAVAGWGWCQGIDAAADAKLALKALSAHGLSDYVADIEPGHHNSVWTIDEIQTFCAAVRKGVSGGFAISSFALIDWHEPQLFRAAADYVDAVAPQIYWFDYPNARMVNEFHRPNGSAYTAGDPASYAELCLNSWKKTMGGAQKPIILTGQAYWGEGNTQGQAEAKLNAFLDSWNGYGGVAAVNWWHFGGSAGMSHAMLERITAAKLGDKHYAT